MCLRIPLEISFLDPKDLLSAFLRGNAGIDLWCVSHTSWSKSAPSGSRFKRSGGVCSSPTYTSNWLFSKLRHLVILSDSIKPWPMTSTPYQNSLLALLLKYKELFDGMFGDWKLPPVSIELKEGAKPYHGRPNPIPKVHKATLMKEIDRLIAIGVSKWQPLSKWASPSFIIPKKDHTGRTISDFRCGDFWLLFARHWALRMQKERAPMDW